MNPTILGTFAAVYAGLRWALLIILFGLGQPAWSANSPEIERGLAWLSAQVQSDGRLADEALSLATPHQARSETERTLLKLTGLTHAELAEVLVADPEDASEYLARTLVATNIADPRFTPLLNTLLYNQNVDGGFGGGVGHTSNPLDTAWALLAHKAAGSQAPVVGSALAYLQGAQQADGAYAVAVQPQAYVTAIALSALRAYASQYPLAIVIDKAAAYLAGRQNPDGGWDNAPALTAVVYLAIHDFIAQEPMATMVGGYLMAQQDVDGSWDGDPYTTALTLSALAATAEPPANPSLSILRGQVVDAQTGLPLSGVEATLTGGASANRQTAHDGLFEFRDLPPSQYALQVTAAGYATITALTATQAGQTQDLGALQLAKPTNATTGTAKGRVTDSSTGQPITGATVIANGTATATTDALGQYQIGNLSTGAVTLEVAMTGYATAFGSANLVAGGIVVYSPALAPANGAPATTATLQGIVTSATTGLPLAAARITVSGASALETTTDVAGAYTLPGLNEGLTMVTATLSGYDTVSASTVVSRNSTITFSPKMYPSATTPPGANTAGVTGIVLDAGTNQPLANVTIQATFGTTTQSLQTGADGRFNLSGMTVASVNFDFTLTGYQGSAVNVALEPLVEIDIGQVRLRKTKVEALLPDLTVKTVSRQGAVTDPQALTVTGSVTATLANVGTASTPADIRVLAFHDANLSGAYEYGVDAVLGQTTLAAAIAPGAEIQILIPVAGALPFRDAPIHVWVESAVAVVESDEGNNALSTTSQCVQKPGDGGVIDLKLKWHWRGSPSAPTSYNVYGPPVVAPIADTNGDGGIDKNDYPILIFSSFPGGSSAARLNAINGLNAQQIWSNANHDVTLVGSAAVADIDNDGLVDIVITSRLRKQLLAFNHDGSLKWAAPTGPTFAADYWGARDGITVADLDGDGQVEILHGRRVFRGDGGLKWEGSQDYGGEINYGFISVAADVNLDGQQEVIAGRTLYSAAGQVLWHRSSIPYDGFNAVGNFDDDDYAEIVLVSNGKVYLLDHLGNTIWGPVSIPGGGRGGPPTVADFDGDGKPEIGVAGANYYTVFDTDGSLLWSARTQDYSSNRTGSSVFDFDGDGKAEVVYSDEVYLFVFDGSTGSIRARIPNGSGTTLEYPIVVDVDNDGHANLIVTSGEAGVRGVRAFESADVPWLATRSIWNQHAYSITNVNDDGTIPKRPQPSWLLHNAFRLNTLMDRDPLGIPDLTASLLEIVDKGKDQPFGLKLRVGNGGAAPSANAVVVRFFDGDPDAAGVAIGDITLPMIERGAYVDVMMESTADLTHGSVHAWIDPDARIVECQRDNNRISIPLQATSLGVIAVATDRPTYVADEIVTITTSVVNKGRFAHEFGVHLFLETNDGELVTEWATQPVTLSAGESRSLTNTWSTGTTAAGPYRARAVLLSSNGAIRDEATAPFAIVVGDPTLTAALWTDKQTYAASDTVRITGRVANATVNLGLTGLMLNEILAAPDGTTTDLGTRALPELPPGGLNDQVFTHALSQAPAGVYMVTQTVRDAGGQVLDTRQVTFEVLSSALTGAGLTGTLSVTPKETKVGEAVSLTYSLTNQGNAALAGLPVTLRVVNPATQTVLFEYPTSLDLAENGSHAGNQVWTATGRHGDVLVAVLAVLVGGQARTVAQDSFTLVDPIQLDIGQAIAPAARLLVLAACEGHGEGYESDRRTVSERQDSHNRRAVHPARAGCGHGCDRDCDEDGDGHDEGDGHGGHCGLGRAQALDALLDGLGVAHRVTTDPAIFRRELRSGAYTVYWISGKVDKLKDDLALEIREAVYRGEGLILDGVHDERNKTLDEAAGIVWRGKLGSRDQSVYLQAPVFVPLSLASIGRGLKLDIATGSVVGRYGGPAGQSAVVANTYGQGQALLFGFDLVASLEANSDWPDEVALGIEAITPAVPDSHDAGAWLPVTTRIGNLGAAADVEVHLTLPVGGAYQWADPQPASVGTAEPSVIVWRFPLAVDAVQTLDLVLRLPEATGDHRLVTQVGTLAGTTYVPYGEPLELTLRVDAAGPGLVTVRADIANLPVSQRDRQERDRAATRVQAAITAIQTGRWEDVLDALLDAAELLAGIDSADTGPARLGLGRALKEAQWHWAVDNSQ